MASKIEGDFNVTGNASFATLTLPASCVSNSNVASDAAIATDKLVHLYKAGNGDPATTTATAKTFPLFVATTTATVEGFRCGCYAAPTGGGTETVSFDLKKNGTTMLTGTVAFTDSDSDRDIKSGTLTGSATLAAGDWLTMVVTVSGSGGTQGTGAFGWVQVSEANGL